MSEKQPKWTFWEISDADEPGDAVMTGMRHRDFDGVTLVLWPDDEGGWLYTEEMERPARPLLLFYRGGYAEVEDARTWLKNDGLDNSRVPSVPFPTTFEDYDGGNETTRKVEAHLNFPPYPWLVEAKLGLEMGRYFNRVELTDWTDPTETHNGSYTFRFYHSRTKTGYGLSY